MTGVQTCALPICFAAVIEPDGRLGFRALIRDDGDTHLFATAHVTVGTAEQPASATWDAVSHGVLPGQSVVFANRETLPVWTTGELAASLVVAPSDAGEATDFVPVGASTAFVPDGSLDVTDLGACENLDRGPTMRASLAATGSIGVVPAVRFDVFDVGGRIVDGAVPLAGPIAWPGTTEQIGRAHV